MDGWERHPATHGTFYTVKFITAEQRALIEHRIQQVNIKNWVNSPAE